jgi:hypothetical protein
MAEHSGYHVVRDAQSAKLGRGCPANVMDAEVYADCLLESAQALLQGGKVSAFGPTTGEDVR